jgi:hypothetical protein
MTKYITELIEAAKTAKKTIEYEHQTKTGRITSLEKRRYEIIQSTQAAVKQIDAAIRNTRKQDYSNRHHDPGG